MSIGDLATILTLSGVYDLHAGVDRFGYPDTQGL